MNTGSVEDHFKKADSSVKELYDRLLTAFREFGPVIESPKKTCIHLDNKTGFAGVYVRRDYINLVLRTDYPIDNPRVAKTEQISKNRYHNTIRVNPTERFDKQFAKWLKDAYQLS